MSKCIQSEREGARKLSLTQGVFVLHLSDCLLLSKVDASPSHVKSNTCLSTRAIIAPKHLGSRASIWRQYCPILTSLSRSGPRRFIGVALAANKTSSMLTGHRFTILSPSCGYVAVRYCSYRSSIFMGKKFIAYIDSTTNRTHDALPIEHIVWILSDVFL